MKQPTIHILLFGLFAVMLSACAPSSGMPASPTVDMEALSSQVAATLTASAPTATETPEPTQTPWVITATQTNTAIPTNTPWIVTATYTNTATPSNTPLVTNTPTKTNTPAKTNTPRPTNTPEQVCNQAELVAHVTVPQGTFIAPAKEFTKIWRIKNTGTCAWNDDYQLIFEDGTNMAAKDKYALPGRVNPGNTVDIAIKMVSPKKDGDYGSQWFLRSDDGDVFGLNAGGRAPIVVGILVSDQVHGEYVFDFAANACLATWKSAAGPVRCPSNSTGSTGYVIPSLNPFLETRHEDEPGILVQADEDEDGFLRGVFPPIEIASGDRFVAAIGCYGGSPQCRVRFTLSYVNENGVEKELGSWSEIFDGQLTQIDIGLSGLAGKDIRFVLTVEPSNQNASQADGVWFLPSIRN